MANLRANKIPSNKIGVVMPVAGYEDLAVNRGLLLDLQFREGIGGLGLPTHDYAKPHHTTVLSKVGGATGPAWVNLGNNLTVLSFSRFAAGAGDYLQRAAADVGDLDFTTEDFTLAAWIHVVGLAAGSNMVFCVNATDVCGWCWYLTLNPANNNYLSFRTNQGGAHTDCYASDFSMNEWIFIGVTRTGTVAQIYKNGAPRLTTGAIANAVDCACGKKLLVGCQDGEASCWFDGMMWRPRIWNRKLEDEDMASIFAMERALFGV